MKVSNDIDGEEEEEEGVKVTKCQPDDQVITGDRNSRRFLRPARWRPTAH